MATHKLIDSEAMVTANFIEQFDQMFNALNSCSYTSTRPKEYAISKRFEIIKLLIILLIMFIYVFRSEVIPFLKTSLEWLKGVKPLGKKLLPSLCGWSTTIKGVILLWEDISQNYDVEYLHTRRLHIIYIKFKNYLNIYIYIYNYIIK